MKNERYEKRGIPYEQLGTIAEQMDLVASVNGATWKGRLPKTCRVLFAESISVGTDGLYDWMAMIEIREDGSDYDLRLDDCPPMACYRTTDFDALLHGATLVSLPKRTRKQYRKAYRRRMAAFNAEES